MKKLTLLLDDRTYNVLSELAIQNAVSIESYTQMLLVEELMKSTASPKTVPKPGSFPIQPPKPGPTSEPSRGTIKLHLKGEVIALKTSRNALILLLNQIFEIKPDMVFQLATHPSLKSKSRRLLAQNPSDLYSSAPHLRDLNVRLDNGWYMATNYSHDRIVTLIKNICKLTGLEYGKDVKLTRGD